MTSRRSFLRAAVAAGVLGAHGLPRVAFAQQATEPDGVWQRLQAEVPSYFQPGRPRGLQLSFGDDDLSRRTATWLTSDVEEGSVVQWGPVGVTATSEEVTHRDLTHTQQGSSERAPFGEGDVADIVNPIRDNGENIHHGEREVFVHRATISGAEPGARIAYRVGDGTRWSDIRLTSGGPLPDEQFRFTHVGDHGTSLAGQRTTRAILAKDPAWHLFAGDIAYANGDQRLWDLWAELYSPTGGSIPTMASPGNHEAKDFMGQTYRTRFSFPNHGSSFFSWTYGNVFLVSTAAGAFFGDREGVMEDVSYELVWMEQTLATAAALRAAGLIDFIVVTQHFPSYTHHETRGPISPDRVVAAEQILQRYQVDLLLVGHDHMYQRSYPMAYGMPTSGDAYTNHLGVTSNPPERFSNATGYIEVIAGAGGNSLYEFTPNATLDPAPATQRRLPWLASAAREVSFAEYTVAGPELSFAAYGWDDGAEAPMPNGLPGEGPEPYHPNDSAYRKGGPKDTAPVVIDRFTLTRKAYAGEVPTTPRPTAEVLRDLPEANGVLVYNRAEDCTAHDH